MTHHPASNEALCIVGIVVVSMAVVVVVLKDGPDLLLQAFAVVLIPLGLGLYRAARPSRHSDEKHESESEDA